VASIADELAKILPVNLEMTDGQVQLRFRHTAGDIGPISFHDSVSIQQVKEKVVAEWPKDGPLTKEAPSQAGDLKLIMSGKFVEATKLLRDYRKDMGEVKPDTIVTMHIVIRPTSTPAKAPGPQQQEKQQQQKGCGCIIA